jgi:hypothetical protein
MRYGAALLQALQDMTEPAKGDLAMQSAMRGLALFRIVLGTFTWLAPRTMNRVFGVPRADESPALIYMNRVFGVRAVSLGVGYLASSGRARELWHRLWLLCDSADTAMGAGMAARGRFPAVTAVQALAVTAVPVAIDLAAMRQSDDGNPEE